MVCYKTFELVYITFGFKRNVVHRCPHWEVGIMNRWHLLAIVFAVGAINVGISIWKGVPFDLTAILNSSIVAALLGGVLLLFDWWIWRIPALHPWFVPVPCIRGDWEISGDINWVRPNKTNQFPGKIFIKQTYFSIWARIDWDEGSRMRFLKKVPITASEEGLCAFTVVYEFEPISPDKTPTTRRAGFFFHSDERRPKVVTLFYSTTDNQIGRIRLSKRERMSIWRWLMPY